MGLGHKFSQPVRIFWSYSLVWGGGGSDEQCDSHGNKMVPYSFNRENVALGIESSDLQACRYSGLAYNPNQGQIWARLDHSLLSH